MTNEFYARDTSRKIRAVQKAKGERGVPLTTNVPYGYVKDLENPRRWVVDPVAADVVKRIFDLCMKGRGPMQIANQLKADKVLTPSAYRALQGIKTPNKKTGGPLRLAQQYRCGDSGTAGVHGLYGELQDLYQLHLGQEAAGQSP